LDGCPVGTLLSVTVGAADWVVSVGTTIVGTLVGSGVDVESIVAISGPPQPVKMNMRMRVVMIFFISCSSRGPRR
jgi:hypothetical protein